MPEANCYLLSRSPPPLLPSSFSSPPPPPSSPFPFPHPPLLPLLNFQAVSEDADLTASSDSFERTIEKFDENFNTLIVDLLERIRGEHSSNHELKLMNMVYRWGCLLSELTPCEISGFQSLLFPSSDSISTAFIRATAITSQPTLLDDRGCSAQHRSNFCPPGSPPSVRLFFYKLSFSERFISSLVYEYISCYPNICVFIVRHVDVIYISFCNVDIDSGTR